MAVYVTGDMHGDKTRFENEMLRLNGTLGEPDTLLVCGDFGFVFGYTYAESRFLTELEKLPYTIATVLGNHENYPRIYANELVEWNGGRAYKLAENVFALKNGEIYSIEGKSFFVFGGAASIDHSSNDGPWHFMYYDYDDEVCRRRNASRWFRFDGNSLDIEVFSLSELDKKGSVDVNIYGMQERYELIDKFYESLKPVAEKYLPKYYEKYCSLEAENADERAYKQAIKLDNLLGRGHYHNIPEIKTESAHCLIDAMRELGYKGDSFRVLIDEGSWWSDELPTAADYENAEKNLKKNSGKADFMLAHNMPASVISASGAYTYPFDMELTSTLDRWYYNIAFERMLCGHWHKDAQIGKVTLLYKDIIKII